MEREWKLGSDLDTSDNVLDGFTFDDVILAVHHSRAVNEKTVNEVVEDILSQRLEDMRYLIKNNVEEIINEAMKGRN